MVYLKSLFVNFLVVFFTSHVLQGIEVVNATKLPHVGSDIIFAAILGLLISLIYPVLKLVWRPPTILRITFLSVVFAFGAYAILKVIPSGIEITGIRGYSIASALVALGGFITNYWEYRAHKLKIPHPPEEPPPIG